MCIQLGSFFELEILSYRAMFLRIGSYSRFWNALGWPSH